MKSLVILLFVLHHSTCQILVPDLSWVNTLADNINKMQTDIQSNIQNLNQRIQNNVRERLVEVERLNQNIAQHIATMPMDAINVNGGQSIVTNVNGGTSRTIVSGYSNGELYYLDTVDKIVGNYRIHNETIYNPQSKTMKSVAYKIDLTDPNARPIFIEQ